VPELADVEVYRRYLNATALHQRIAGTHAESDEILQGTSPQGLGRALKDNQFDSSRRHGKYLFIELHNGGWLGMHFGMTGSLAYFGSDSQVPDYTRLLLTFNNGYRLAYVAPRKLGKVFLTDTVQAIIEGHGLGPDALAPSPAESKELAKGRRGSVKSWLMDQQRLAGIGNVYSDEILFQARVHPKQNLSRLDEAALEDLYRNLHQVFDAAIEADADPDRMPRHFLLPQRHDDGQCPRCGGKVKHIQVAGRSAWFCPACQSKG